MMELSGDRSLVSILEMTLTSRRPQLSRCLSSSVSIRIIDCSALLPEEASKNRETDRKYPRRLFILRTRQFRCATVKQYMSRCGCRCSSAPSRQRHCRNIPVENSFLLKGPVYQNHPSSSEIDEESDDRRVETIKEFYHCAGNNFHFFSTAVFRAICGNRIKQKDHFYK